MTIALLLKASSVWLLIAVFAIINGIVRDKLLVPAIGNSLALPVSGLSLSLIVLMVTYLSIGFFGKRAARSYWLIGLQWVLMTLAFEFLFGHYVAGKSWQEIAQVFNVMSGNLMLLVLVTSLISPYLVARWKGLIN